MARIHLGLLLALGLFAPAKARADEAEAQAAFSSGVALMDRQQYGDAIVQLKRAEAAFPTAPPLLWNLGLASVEVGNHREALAYWRKYQKAQPADWKAVPKIIQAHQALGDRKARDREIKGLRARRAREPGSELGRAERFCREQMVVAGRKVLVFETFEPQGEQRIFYRFAVTDAAGQEVSSISLGSYDSTTQVARDLGAIPRTGRAYHIDRYEGQSHQSYAHYDKQPAYETVREAVVAILQGKTPAVSGGAR